MTDAREAVEGNASTSHKESVCEPRATTGPIAVYTFCEGRVFETRVFHRSETRTTRVTQRPPTLPFFTASPVHRSPVTSRVRVLAYPSTSQNPSHFPFLCEGYPSECDRMGIITASLTNTQHHSRMVFRYPFCAWQQLSVGPHLPRTGGELRVRY